MGMQATRQGSFLVHNRHVGGGRAEARGRAAGFPAQGRDAQGVGEGGEPGWKAQGGVEEQEEIWGALNV
eukprot:2503906-Rhodomonas_salina.1